jgi:hypothetical protein
MFNPFKKLLQPKIEEDCDLETAVKKGLITEEERLRLECERADRRLKEYVMKKVKK